jgi:general stress protein 26
LRASAHARKSDSADEARIMDKTVRRFILDIIEREHDLTLATVRDVGYPQATTVSYASDGLTIYVGTGKDSQKVRNIRRCDKVSLTIDTDYSDWNQIKGLSMAARAEVLEDRDEIAHAAACLVKKFPQAADWATPEESGDVVFLKITPEVISVLDYRKGFGHTELVRV